MGGKNNANPNHYKEEERERPDQDIAPKKMAAIYFRLIVLVLAFGLSLSCVAPGASQQTSSPAETSSNATVNTPSPSSTPTPPVTVGEPEFDAVAWYSERVKDLDLHTALVATLEPGKNFAEYNVEKVFNPASLVKLSTTLVALKKLGADHRYAVSVYAEGELDEDGKLNGDMYFSGSAPTFNDISADVVADELEKRGIKRITGKLYVSPDFSFNYSNSAKQSARLLAGKLRFEREPKTAVSDKTSGTELFVFKSFPLPEVLLYMNTFSSNFVAHKLGEKVGGVEAVRQFLIDELKFEPEKVKLDTTSGLKENGMTARDIFLVLRALAEELKRQNLKPADVLSMAAESSSTLDRRLTDTNFERAMLGKTGTLSAADGGVGMASLAGLVYTKNNGIVAFVLMNQGPNLSRHRDLQDMFLKEVLESRIEPDPFDFKTPRDLLPKSSLQIEAKGKINNSKEIKK